jgi:hypothetical protein
MLIKRFAGLDSPQLPAVWTPQQPVFPTLWMLSLPLIERRRALEYFDYYVVGNRL